MISGSEKLRLVREIQLIRKSLGQSTAGSNKLVLVKRLREIRALLGVAVEKAVGLLVDAGNKTATLQALTEYLKNGINQLPEQLRHAEAATLLRISDLGRQSADIDVQKAFNVAVHDVCGAVIDGQIDAYEYFKSQGQGINFEMIGGKIKAFNEEIERLNNQVALDSPEIIEQKALALLEYERIRDFQNSLVKINGSNGYDEAAINKAEIDYERAVKDRQEVWDKICELDRQKYLDKAENVNAIKAWIAPEGEMIINTMLSASPITTEQADAWANSQPIDKAAIARLKKLGYPIADVRRDMAEFYRISRGKLRRIAISSEGGKRANASGIGSVEGSAVMLGSRFDKKVLWHELAHHLEADPIAKFASNGFLASRRESDTAYSLKSLTGNKGYGRDEEAYKDSWIDHYIGKVYRDQTTEVWSMGVQYLSNPYDAAMLAAKDPEMAAMITGYLAADLSPGMKALQSLQDSQAKLSQGARDGIQEQYDEAVKSLAARVTIVDDGWFDGLEEEDRNNILTSRYYSIGDDVKFVGSWGGYRVFSGKIKKFGTKRKAKGYAVGYTLRTGTMLTGESSTYSGGYGAREVFHSCGFHWSVVEMKATMLVSHELFGNDIARAYRDCFYYGDCKTNMIRYAARIIGVPE